MHSNTTKSRIADLQWRSLVESIVATSKGKLKNCLAVADVSGSMGSLKHTLDKQNPSPIVPCIALTLLLGELSEKPWCGGYFTFSSTPSFETVSLDDSLSQRASQMSRAHWGMATRFDRVFELILVQAKAAKLYPDQMIQKLFVFSDMQFDQAGGAEFGETAYATIKRKFETAGYEIPQLVFWNLAGGYEGTSKPVAADQEGVALMSGFSGALLKYFLGQEDAEEEEDLKEVMDKEWDRVDDVQVEVFGDDEVFGENDQEEKRDVEGSKKQDPLQAILKVVRAESFKGLVVVD